MATTSNPVAAGSPPAAVGASTPLWRRRIGGPITDLIVRRTGLGILTLFFVSILVYLATTVLPGNAATAALGNQATPARLHALERQLHLNRPLISRYVSWLGDVVQGNPGTSLSSHDAVGPTVATALGHSAILVVIAGVLSSVIGIGLGVLAAAKRDSWLDHVMSVVVLFLVALPEFVIAITLTIIFSTVVWHLLPAVSFLSPGASVLGEPKLLVLPVATLVLVTVPYLFRIVRGTMVEALQSDFVEMAELKGVSRRRILFVHALPTVFAPIAQVIALNLLYLAGGIVVVEYVFNFPGVGQLLVESISGRDIPTVQWIVLLLATFYIAVNIVADVIALAVTPRRRLPRRA
jgi:peptide/nickel transport system permease protein